MLCRVCACILRGILERQFRVHVYQHPMLMRVLADTWDAEQRIGLLRSADDGLGHAKALELGRAKRRSSPQGRGPKVGSSQNCMMLAGFRPSERARVHAALASERSRGWVCCAGTRRRQRLAATLPRAGTTEAPPLLQWRPCTQCSRHSQRSLSLSVDASSTSAIAPLPRIRRLW